MKRLRNWLLFAAVAGIIVVLGSVTMLLTPAANDLLARSKRLNCNAENYQWLTDHNILIADIFPRNATRRVINRDVETGVTTPIRTFKSRQRNFGIGELTTVLSPDRKKLIWIGSSYLILPLDNAQQWAFPHAPVRIVNGLTPFVPTIAWLPSSDGWVEIQGKNTVSALLVHSLSGGPNSSIPLPAAVGTQTIIGVTPNRRVIIARRRGAVVDGFLSVDLNAQPPAVKTLSVAIPPNADILEIALSPQGDRLAWMTDTWNDMGLALSSWITAQVRHTNELRRRYAIWVSRLDGSEMRSIGSETLANVGGPYPINTLRWLPDGERVSYTYKDSLYTLPTH